MQSKFPRWQVWLASQRGHSLSIILSSQCLHQGRSQLQQSPWRLMVLLQSMQRSLLIMSCVIGENGRVGTSEGGELEISIGFNRWPDGWTCSSIFRARSAEQAWAVLRGRVSRRTGDMVPGSVVDDEVVVVVKSSDGLIVV
jgi:hypothetical protein